MNRHTTHLTGFRSTGFRSTGFRSTGLRFIVMALLAVAAATAAHADYYVVTMTNGTTFQTRYKPLPAGWDDNIVLLNSDRGNWIGLRSDEIAEIASHAETTGFGYQLNTTTLFVGWMPNDVDEEEEDGEGGGGREGGLTVDERFPEPVATGVLQQFVDIPGAEGGGIGGQPVDNTYDNN